MRPVLVPDPRRAARALRPLLWLGALLIAVEVAALVGAPDSEGRYAAAFVLLLRRPFCGGRALSWRLHAAMNGMDADDRQVRVRRWGTSRTYPWATSEVTVLRREAARPVRVTVLALGRGSLETRRLRAAPRIRPPAACA